MQRKKTSQKKKSSGLKKKRNKRSKAKYPALQPELNLRSRYEFIDFDYVDKLSEEEKTWLNTFAEEYINANFNHGKKIMHKTQELKKDCYDRNNSRNRDVLTRAKASGETLYLEDLKLNNKEVRDFLTEEPEDFNDTSNDGKSNT